jgi:hypothetical protein
MPRTVPVTVEVTGLPATEAAIADAVSAERRRLLTLARATCACQSCKDGFARILAEPAQEPPGETTEETDV